MKVLLVGMMFLLSYSSYSLALDVKSKAQVCVACHGINGISPNPIWPNLAGQKKDYLEKQLTFFKSKQRVDPMMNPIAENLSEKEISDLSKYFSDMGSK